MSQLTIGPFFSRSNAQCEFAEVEHVGCSLEFATPDYSESAQIYRVRKSGNTGAATLGQGISDFFVHETEIPCDVTYFAVFAKNTTEGRFIRLEDVLLSLYRNFSVRRPTTELLTEFRDTIKWENRFAGERCVGMGLLTHELSSAGFGVAGFLSYGRTLTVGLNWRPIQDREQAGSHVEVSLGYVDFRPLPNRTLGRGRWLPGRGDFLGLVLRDELERICVGPPCRFLSAAGHQAAMTEFVWQPLTLMTTQEARQARIQFVKQNPHFWSEPRRLAKALLEAKLYADSTGIHQIVKHLPKLITEARQLLH